MRQIAERLLPNAAGTTYVDREIVNQTLKPLKPPRASFHIYCSALNPGAAELISEVSRDRGFRVVASARTRRSLTRSRPRRAGKAAALHQPADVLLHVTSDADQLAECDHMLLYLTSQTWTRGEASAALGLELMEAMDLKLNVLLVHEMTGAGGQEARFGCEFASFFAFADGTTPTELLNRGIYSSIAVPLKGGPLREASMVLLGIALGMGKDDVAAAIKGVVEQSGSWSAPSRLRKSLVALETALSRRRRLRLVSLRSRVRSTTPKASTGAVVAATAEVEIAEVQPKAQAFAWLDKMTADVSADEQF